jgi:hypothetical protein
VRCDAEWLAVRDGRHDTVPVLSAMNHFPEDFGIDNKQVELKQKEAA